MRILGIETSCDDTTASVLDKNTVLSNVITRQIIHEEYKGVVPELASREHLRLIHQVVNKALKDAKTDFSELDGIAVTYGPGLVGAVLVGLNFAKGLSVSHNIPLIGVNHLEGHIAANYISNEDWKPPYITLLVSGGHSQLIHVKDYFDFEILGTSIDDAVGEAFDKTAKLLDLGYPGGPIIDRYAKNGNPKAIPFPIPYVQNDNLNFSYSGLKTAVLNYVKKTPDYSLEDVCASFQYVAIEALIKKLLRAAKHVGLKRIAIAGGVSANSYLRQRISDLQSKGFEFNFPAFEYCTDNAAMIAKAGQLRLSHGFTSALSLNAKPVLPLDKTRAYVEN